MTELLVWYMQGVLPTHLIPHPEVRKCSQLKLSPTVTCERGTSGNMPLLSPYDNQAYLRGHPSMDLHSPMALSALCGSVYSGVAKAAQLGVHRQAGTVTLSHHATPHAVLPTLH